MTDRYISSEEQSLVADDVRCIVRVWRGTVDVSKADQYLSYLRLTGIAAYKKSPGFLSAEIWTKRRAQNCHIYLISKWRSMDDMKEFGGLDAVYYSLDEHFLTTVEQRIRYFNCVIV